MNTFPGAAHTLSAQALDEQQIRDSAILYLEAYLWRPEGPRAAMKKAIEVARAANRQVALTLSDIACIASARQSFLDIIDAGQIDMLFANENEIKALAGTEGFEDAVAAFKDKVPLLVVTCSEKGAVGIDKGRRVSIDAQRIDGVVDTTGAGDLFAAGFLAAQAQGRPLEERLHIGAIAAAEVISHFGARPEADLKALVEERLGA
jgi:sugar/nucleoside kinase (ribokinase family)